MKRDYKVTITATTSHEYHIPECNSPEEAEAIAEAYFADGEDGEVESQDVDDIETVPEEGGE